MNKKILLNWRVFVILSFIYFLLLIVFIQYIAFQLNFVWTKYYSCYPINHNSTIVYYCLPQGYYTLEAVIISDNKNQKMKFDAKVYIDQKNILERKNNNFQIENDNTRIKIVFQSIDNKSSDFYLKIKKRGDK